MRYTSALVLAAAGLAAAQSSSTSAASSSSTSSSSSGSGACPDQQNTIETCLSSTKPQVEACKANDWVCLCENSRAVDTCYAGCPSDPGAFAQQQTTTSYCDAAKAYGSSSSANTMSATGTSGTATATLVTATSTSSDAGTAVQTGFAEASGSGAAASASESGNAASGYAPAGGLLAAIFGLALI